MRSPVERLDAPAQLSLARVIISQAFHRARIVESLGTRLSTESTHKFMGFYMEVLIL